MKVAVDATCHTVPCPWLHEACSSYTCRVMERPCRARMRRAVPCQNVLCQRTCRARTCRAVPCHAVPCHAMPCRGLQRTGCPTIKVVTPTKKVALPRKKVVTAPGSSYPPHTPCIHKCFESNGWVGHGWEWIFHFIMKILLREAGGWGVVFF